MFWTTAFPSQKTKRQGMPQKMHVRQREAFQALCYKQQRAELSQDH
jgi:hypothetical protein